MLRSIEMSPRANLSNFFRIRLWRRCCVRCFPCRKAGPGEIAPYGSRLYRRTRADPNRWIWQSENTFAFANAKRGRFLKYWRAAIDQIISRRKASSTAPSIAISSVCCWALGMHKPAKRSWTAKSATHAQRCFSGVRNDGGLLFWACFLLAMDFDEQTRVREELTAFRPERIDGSDDLQNWRRLRNVLLEALRSIVRSQIVRVANGTDDICGEKISANTQVWISSWVMHRHWRFWDQPTAFVPGRFAGKPPRGRRCPPLFHLAPDPAFASACGLHCWRPRWSWRSCCHATRSACRLRGLCCQSAA